MTDPKTPAAVPVRESRRDGNFVHWFLFVGFTLAFLLLAWRSETNAHAISNGLYSACLARVETAHQYNEGREALVQWIITNPSRSRTPEERDLVTKQLRDGLLLPVENCGAAPE